MRILLDRFFQVSASESTVKREIVAGITTFMTMAYIVFVNPAILSAAFIPPGAAEADQQLIFRALVAATCLAAAFGTILMGIVARYPIALAPGMGLNAFFTYTICLQMNVPWTVALGMVFLSGLVFMLLSLVRIREMIIDAVPDGLKHAAAVGIGVFIAFIGLKQAGLIVGSGETFVKLGTLTSKPVLVALAGLVITAVLTARRVRGAILLGIVCTGVIGYFAGIIHIQQKWFAAPHIAPVFAKLDILGAFKPQYLSAILVLLFFDMFDTVGTLIGVSEQAGFMREGKLPRANRALFCDAAATTAGSVFGTSTVTSYIESAAGVAEGGRTGLANMVTALLFVLAMFFAPIAEAFGGGLEYQFTISAGQQLLTISEKLYPVTAPALVVVGCLMMANVGRITFSDWTEALPAFLTIVLMPLTFSISSGLFAGLLSYPILKLATGQGRQVHWLLYLLMILFVCGLVGYYAYAGL